MKKYVLPLLVVVALAIIAAWLFLFKKVNALEGVPSSALMVIQVKNWNEINNTLSTTYSGMEAGKTYAVQKLKTELQTLAELLSADNSLKEIISSSQTTASVHLTAADDFDFLFTTVIGSVNDNTILNRMQTSPKVKSVRVRIFKNQKVTDVMLNNGSQLTFTVIKGILSCSFTSFLTESSAMALMNGKSVMNEESFRKTISTVSESGLNVLVNYKSAEVFLPLIFKQEKSFLLADAKQNGEWVNYEIVLSNNGIHLKGIGYTADKSAKELEHNLFENELLATIPDNAAVVNISTTSSDLNDSSVSALKYFSRWTANAKAYVVLEPFREDFSNQSALFVSVKNISAAKEDLRKLINAEGAEPVPSDTFFNDEIFKLSDGSLLNHVFKNSLITFQNASFTVHGNTAIFCNSNDVLKFILDKISKSETLGAENNFENTSYTQFAANDAVSYVNLKRSDLLLNGLLKDNSTARQMMNEFKTIFEHHKKEGSKILSEITFSMNGDKTSSAGLLWKTKLKTLSVYKPQMVQNAATSENEIFTQDTAGNIYLLSASGEILFTKNIGEAIVSDVKQIDYYRNGQQQFIFNTAKHVFLLNRLGIDMASYPLRLPYAATAGMTLMTDTQAKIYRYFIPCGNDAIYGYDASGKPLPGWSPKSGVGKVVHSLQTFKNVNINFLLAFNNNGKLQLYDEKGNTKWSVSNLPVTRQDFAVLAKAKDFVLLNASGNQLTQISSDGNDNIKPLMDTAVSFAAIFTSDTDYVYFFSNAHQIRSYNASGNFLNAIEIQNADISAIEILKTNSQQYLLAYDDSSKNIFVYNLQLQPLGTFSFTTTCIFDLFKPNELVSVSPTADGFICCTRLSPVISSSTQPSMLH